MRLEHEILELEPEFPFRISRSVQDSIRRVWVRIEADGVEGWGEADPADYYGETAETATEALEAMRPAIEAADDPDRLEVLEARMLGLAPDQAAARAAVSAALHDLVGKRRGEPLWRLWGLDPDEAPLSSFTIGIDEPEVVARKARAARDFPILKIKLGGERDREILEAVREEAPDADLRVDANAAWTADEALEEIAVLAEFGVEFVEQPLPPGDREGMRFVWEHSPLPVILDESCLVASDIPDLMDQADGISIKLAKCGGPREALRMIHTARACGLDVMMGCMLESTLGIAAAAHLSPLLDYADLDGAALLAEDPFRGPSMEEGRIVLDDAPGLGVERA